MPVAWHGALGPGYASAMVHEPNSTYLPETTHNAAQEARQAAGDEVKRIADVPSVHGGETWANASGHSGTRAAWFATGAILAGFVLGGVGLTVGPRLVIWIGVAVVVIVAVFGTMTHVWSDYRPRPESNAEQSAAGEGTVSSPESARGSGSRPVSAETSKPLSRPRRALFRKSTSSPRI